MLLCVLRTLHRAQLAFLFVSLLNIHTLYRATAEAKTASSVDACEAGDVCYVPNMLLAAQEAQEQGQGHGLEQDPASASTSASTSTQHCVFRSLPPPQAQTCISSAPSSLHVWQAPGVPDMSMWSRCQHCMWGVQSGRVQVWGKGSTEGGGAEEEEEEEEEEEGEVGNATNKSSSSNAHAPRTGAMDLSASNWGEFFHSSNNSGGGHDRLQGHYSAAPPVLEEQGQGQGQGQDSTNHTAVYVSRPVFLLPLLTLHVGHVMVDLLEQVYGTMMSCYGRVRKDALLILDVANVQEQQVLPLKLYQLLAGPADTYGALFRVLSDLPVLPLSVLRGGGQGLGGIGVTHVVFKDVHMGLNGNMGHFSAGFASHGLSLQQQKALPVHAVQARRLMALQQEIFETLQVPLKSGHQQRDKREEKSERKFRTALIIERAAPAAAPPPTSSTAAAAGNVDTFPGYISTKPSRHIANLEQVVAATLAELCPLGHKALQQGQQDNRLDGYVARCVNSQHGKVQEGHAWEVKVKVLEDMRHSEQRAMFATADVLIAAAGTALHNCLFMRRPAAVLPIMQPGWCPWAWMYVRQAQLLGFSAIPHCAVAAAAAPEGSIPGRSLHQWSRHFWQQGPRHTKDSDVRVTVPAFRKVLRQLVKEVEEGHREQMPGEEGEGGEECGVEIEEEEEEEQEGVEEKEEKKEGRTEKEKNSHLPPPPVDPQALAEVYVTSVQARKTTTISADGAVDRWDLSLRGELALPSGIAAVDSPLAHMPHLCLCLRVPQSRSPPSCTPLEDLNYYSELRLQIAYPAQELLLWLQASSSGGRIQGSECLVAIDVRLPGCGLLPLGPLPHLQMAMQGRSKGTSAAAKVVALWVTQDQHNEWFAKALPGLHVGATHHIVLTTGLALQRQLPTMCALHRIPMAVCGEVASRVTVHVYRHILAARLKVPAVQFRPTPQHPFVFLHVEKTAGTTLRELIVQSAEQAKFRFFVPCHGNPAAHSLTYVHCTVLSPADVLRYHNGSQRLLRGVSVLAGHFAWGMWGQLPDWALAHGSLLPSPPPSLEVFEDAAAATAKVADAVVGVEEKEEEEEAAGEEEGEGEEVPACFVMGRHPVDRAISYYYQRCYDSPACAGYGKMLNTLSVETLEHVMRTHRHMLLDPARESSGGGGEEEYVVVLDEGMADAACAALADSRRTAGRRLPLSQGSMSAPAPASASTRARALQNIAHCVVGMQEQWGSTVDHLLHFFPWLKAGAETETWPGANVTERVWRWRAAPRRMQLFAGQESLLTLRPALRIAIEAANSCDMALYVKMQEMFRQQQQVVDTMQLFV